MQSARMAWLVLFDDRSTSRKVQVVGKEDETEQRIRTTFRVSGFPTFHRLRRPIKIRKQWKEEANFSWPQEYH